MPANRRPPSNGEQANDASVEAFYRGLLELDTLLELEPVISRAVELVTYVTGARVGYVEFFPVVERTDAPFVSFHCNDEGPTEVTGWVSRGIIAASIEERSTINLASAVEHPQFRSSPSVVANAIRAVLCTPIGIGSPVGVVYIQGRHGPGRFTDRDRERTELFAARLALISDRLRTRRASRLNLDDEVRSLEERRVRQSLDRNDGNLSSVARELGINRPRLYRILKRSP